ncbi:GFA family protein [Pseudomonas sp. 7P_10.2_Bac1]|uniref:GFA family protein n=1 Tax=Pseudomonas sp. 7P_10.2_Bac1 TaxID=2971614 RepID=UPI0021C6ADAF|nr:GFA family protein [Pseudomonas sp. 7P_10.2_Bac1]MCU1726968.1 GFA family protein [Pseudomonas sp. 7P_10.2_Bac1]
MNNLLLGSCLCGVVRYQTPLRPVSISHCHCSQCRKHHGAAYASFCNVLREDLELTHGAENLKSFESSPSVSRQFCGECGSSLFWSTSQGQYADWISIAVGTLDTPIHCDKQKHICVASKAGWHEITDPWPQHR